MISGCALAWRLEPPAEPGDEALVREVRAGASDRFGLLVRRHWPALRRAVARVVRDRAEAEDVLQQAFLQAFAGLEGWSASAPFSTWLRRIAVNEALMRLRRSRRQARAVTQLARSEGELRDSPEQEAVAREEVARLTAAFPHLPARHREILQLAALHELPRPELARRLGISEGAVKVRLHRAREALRVLLRDGGEPDRGRGPRLTLASARPGLIGYGGGEDLRPE